jgi:hypothetical protein
MSQVIYGPEGSQIIQIEGTNTYYIAVDVGDTMYFYEVPDNFSLKEMTDITSEIIDDPQLYENYVQGLKETGDLIVIDDDSFKSKVYQDDRIVVVGKDVLQLQADYDDVDSITAMLTGLEDLKTNAEYWTNDIYLDALNDYVMKYGIDKIDDFYDSKELRTALDEMNYSVARYNGETRKVRDRDGWEADVADYTATLKDYVLFDLEAELPDAAIAYAAEQWATGWSEVLSSIAEGGTVKASMVGHEDVQDLMDMYLTPEAHASFDKEGEASKLRNTPGYQTTLIKKLQKLNHTYYPDLGEDIQIGQLINSKINHFESISGMLLDKDDKKDWGVIDKMLKAKDYDEASKIARSIAYARGSDLFNKDVANAFAAFGSTTIGAQQYVERR